MKIERFKKDKSNKYKIIIDGEEYTLYDDIIVKYMLTMKKDIDEKEFEKIKKENDELFSYYNAIKYITVKLRSEKEIVEYLKKKDIDISVINKTVKKLKDNGFINDDIYLKSYINDQINLTNYGPIRIKKNLLKLGLDENKIDIKLNEINDDIWIDKINHLISKKIKLNHTSSSYVLRNKIINDLINQGYLKSMIIDIIDEYTIDDKEILEKEKKKIINNLSKKYEGYELELKVKEKLYRKGFKIGDIDEK